MQNININTRILLVKLFFVSLILSSNFAKSQIIIKDFVPDTIVDGKDIFF